MGLRSVSDFGMFRKNDEVEDGGNASLEPSDSTDGFGFVENSSRGTGHMFR